MHSDFAPIIRGVKLLIAERSQWAARGPHFLILHRFWKPETICTPGEAIAEIRFLYRTRQIPVPLSLRLMLLFDYFARHQHLAQCAAQIAAGLNSDPFTQRHGAHARVIGGMSKRSSRTAVKQQIMRIRVGMDRTFRQVGLRLYPGSVLLSEQTTTNEVRYRLKASVVWEHLET
jgi:hypothetical protein